MMMQTNRTEAPTRGRHLIDDGMPVALVATGLDAGALGVRTRVNGDLRQDYPISDMVFTPVELVSHISHHMTLLPGDIIACGTSVGVGSLKPGALVEIEIDGVGVLSNTFE